MSNTDYLKFLPILIAVLTFIIKNFNSENKRYIEAKNKYFEDVLAVYVSKFRINDKINSIKFLKQKKFEGSYFIPPYVWKLIKDGEKDKLHKILIVDYKNNYPTLENNLFNTINKIGYIIEFICIICFATIFSLLIFLVIDLIFIFGIDICNYLISNKNNFEIKNYLGYGIGFIGSFLMIFIVGFCIKKIIKMEGEYCTKKSVVENNIHNKIEIYKDIIDENYLI